MEYFICYDFNKIRVKLDGGYLTQDQATILHGGIVSIYIVYEISKKVHISNYPTLENCLFGTAKLTKNGDIDKYGYSGYGIGFDRYGHFLLPDTGLGRNIIFGVDFCSSTMIDNRKKIYFNSWKRSDTGFRTYIKC